MPRRTLHNGSTLLSCLPAVNSVSILAERSDLPAENRIPTTTPIHRTICAASSALSPQRSPYKATSQCTRSSMCPAPSPIKSAKSNDCLKLAAIGRPEGSANIQRHTLTYDWPVEWVALADERHGRLSPQVRLPAVEQRAAGHKVGARFQVRLRRRLDAPVEQRAAHIRE